MYIGDHTSDISRRVRRFAGRRKLDAVEVLDGRRVEVQRIPLIERVDLAARWNLDIGMSKNELAE
jgi:hypothetical protein